MGRTVFLSYASGSDFLHTQQNIARSAIAVGFDEAISLTPHSISSTSFWRDNIDVLERPRGAGYWLWKPYVIQQVLDRLGPNDEILYCDAGRTDYYAFEKFPHALFSRLRSQPTGYITGVSVPQLGPLSRWTKRDCLTLMKADVPEITSRPQIQATWSLWTRSAEAQRFLGMWLSYGSDRRCITDDPNELGQEDLPGFVEHRHDQSISTILTYVLNAPFIDLSGTSLSSVLRLRPQSQVSQTFMKRPGNVDELLSGVPAPVVVAHQALRLRFGR